jgi:hypothetical protein
MTIDAKPITLDWVAVGPGAFGLVWDGRIMALVYWERAGVAQRSGPGGEPVVTDPGFSWVPVDLPWEHFYLFQAPNPVEGDWARARELAARAYFEWTEARSRIEREHPARPRETDDAELRREAAELLRGSEWWQEELLREELLSRKWDGPKSGKHGGAAPPGSPGPDSR